MEIPQCDRARQRLSLGCRAGSACGGRHLLATVRFPPRGSTGAPRPQRCRLRTQNAIARRRLTRATVDRWRSQFIGVHLRRPSLGASRSTHGSVRTVAALQPQSHQHHQTAVADRILENELDTNSFTSRRET